MQRISAGQIWRLALVAAVASLAFSGAAPAPAPQYDVLIGQGTIYDGSVRQQLQAFKTRLLGE